MKALAGAFNQEKALAGAFSVITNLRENLRLKLYPVTCTSMTERLPPPPAGETPLMAGKTRPDWRRRAWRCGPRIISSCRKLEVEKLSRFSRARQMLKRTKGSLIRTKSWRITAIAGYLTSSAPMVMERARVRGIPVAPCLLLRSRDTPHWLGCPALLPASATIRRPRECSPECRRPCPGSRGTPVTSRPAMVVWRWDRSCYYLISIIRSIRWNK